MSTTYAGVPSNVGPNAATPTITAPVDGDSDSAATFTASLQVLTDQTAFLLKVIQGMALENLSLGTNASSASDVAYNGSSTFAAGLQSGTTTHWATSPDGKTWTNITSGGVLGGRSVIWVPSLSLFVGAMGTTGTCGVETSPLGVTWTNRTIPSTVGMPSLGNSIAFGASILVAAVGNTGQVISSPDGITWTARGTTPMASRVMTRVAFGGGQFVAASDDGYIFTSPDGITWTARGRVLTTTLSNTVLYHSKLALYFFFDASSTAYYTSTDAITWTSRTFSPGGGYISAAWGILVATVTVSSVLWLYTSSDGINWTALCPLVPASAQGLRGNVGDRVFVLVGGSSPYVSLAAPNL